MAQAKRKMALVRNPSRSGLNLSGGKVTRRRNPKSTAKRKIAPQSRRRTKRNPAPIVTRRRFKARRNPVTGVGQVLTTALFAGVGVAAFDYLLNKILPAPVAPVFRIASKAGLGVGVAAYGSGLPLVGKYSKEIGLVFVTLAVVDGLQTYVMPMVQNTVGGFMAPALQPVGDEVSGVYGYDTEGDEADDDYNF